MKYVYTVHVIFLNSHSVFNETKVDQNFEHSITWTNILKFSKRAFVFAERNDLIIIVIVSLLVFLAADETCERALAI